MRHTLRFITPRFREALDHLPHLPRALRLVRDSAGRWTLIWAVLLVLQGLLPVATVFLTRELVNALVAASESQGATEAIRLAIGLTVAVAIVLLVAETARALSVWVRTAQSELVADHVHGLIHKKSTALDMAFFDSAAYFDKLHRARSEARTRPALLVEGLGNLLQGSLTLIAMSAVLITFAWWLPVLLIVSLFPAFFLILGAIVRLHQWRIRTTINQRKATYFDFLLTSRETFPEIRLFDLAHHFRSLHDGLRSTLRAERLSLAQREARAQVGAGLFAIAALGGATLWMVGEAAHGRVSLGGLAMFFQAFLQGQRLLRTTLESAGQIYSNMLFLGNLFEFLDLREKIINPENPLPVPAPLQRGIRFRDVNFTYPSSNRRALVDFNLEIPAGATVAVLGSNGAGKTTLFKLLCRFYDLDQGTVEIDGIDIRRFTLEDLRRRIAILFQDPTNFSLTAGDNIALGNLQGQPSLNDLRKAALDGSSHDLISELDNGYDTMLGAWFDGVELSHGQWQRIALSRAFLRQADIVLLDEPTSAMDSWAAASWMDHFLELVKDRTAVLITHRLTTAMRADFIHIIGGGRVIESGSHQELLAAAGIYAQAWQSQNRG
ncbi:MAG: ABC transporter ATP-binding protein/permease [Thermoanaerobaculales bacterium]|nr:ABC transporter ATP-binding protein/permease [Thermoanaerobaculales bacterium]